MYRSTSIICCSLSVTLFTFLAVVSSSTAAPSEVVQAQKLNKESEVVAGAISANPGIEHALDCGESKEVLFGSYQVEAEGNYAFPSSTPENERTAPACCNQANNICQRALFKDLQLIAPSAQCAKCNDDKQCPAFQNLTVLDRPLGPDNIKFGECTITYNADHIPLKCRMSCALNQNAQNNLTVKFGCKACSGPAHGDSYVSPMSW